MFEDISNLNWTKLLLLSTAVIMISGTAASANIQDVEVTDKVDKDGDGKVSSFKVRITADLKIDEAGAEYGDDVIPGKVDFAQGVGSFLEPKGNPKFSVRPRSSGKSYRADMWANPPMEEDSSSTTFEVEYDYDEARQLIDDNSGKNFAEASEKLIEGDRKITGIWVRYYESDSCNECVGPLDKKLDETTADVDNFKLEKPSKDREAEVSIDANTEAKIEVNGDSKGKTPWTGDMPVDVSDKELVDIRLSASGYDTKTVKEEINPPESFSYDLEKKMRPLVVDSDEDEAEVRVNENKIGETPVSQDYWVNEDLKVRVEGENNTETFEDVNTPWRKTVQLQTSSSSGTDYSFGSTFTYDPLYYDNLMTELPDLSGLTIAEFAKSKKKPSPGEDIEFNASDSYSISYSIDSYTWDMGDGSTRTGEAISHSYSSPGNYTVNLTVENSNGTKVSKTSFVNVENRAPQAKMLIMGTEFETGTPVTFNAAPSVDSDGAIVQYEWDFGDGGSTQGTRPTTTHVYSSQGQYIVDLTVTDSAGATKTASRTIEVESPNRDPTASFSISDKNPEQGETVTLDASGSSDSDGSIANYGWNLGNGLSTTGGRVDYRFNHTGVYDVELVVVDDDGASAKVSKKVNVTTGSSSTGSDSTESGSSGSEDDPSASQESSNNQSNEGQQESSGSEDDAIENRGSLEQVLIEVIKIIF